MDVLTLNGGKEAEQALDDVEFGTFLTQ